MCYFSKALFSIKGACIPSFSPQHPWLVSQGHWVIWKHLDMSSHVNILTPWTLGQRDCPLQSCIVLPRPFLRMCFSTGGKCSGPRLGAICNWEGTRKSLRACQPTSHCHSQCVFLSLKAAPSWEIFFLFSKKRGTDKHLLAGGRKGWEGAELWSRPPFLLSSR